MPEAPSTGCLVGFLQWACAKLINPHLDWPQEQTRGTYINFSYEAPPPIGLEVTKKVVLIAVEDKLIYSKEALDSIDLIYRENVLLTRRFDGLVLSFNCNRRRGNGYYRP